MPHYAFDVSDGSRTLAQTERILPDVSAARDLAWRMATDQAPASAPTPWGGGAVVVHVRAQDRPVLRVRLVFDVEALDPA